MVCHKGLAPEQQGSGGSRAQHVCQGAAMSCSAARLKYSWKVLWLAGSEARRLARH